MTAEILKSTALLRDIVDILTCSYIYKVCNGRQWEPITGSDFVAIMNMKPCEIEIHIRYREKSRVCYMLYLVSKSLQATGIGKTWLSAMLVRFGISETYYSSHYSDAQSQTASDESREFARTIRSAMEGTAA